MTTTRIGALAALTMVTALYPLAAQQTQLEHGQTVRVVSSAGRIHSGRLQLVLADTLVLEAGGRQEWIKLGSDDRLEVLRRSRSYALVGALLGAGAGAALGSTSSTHLCTQPITNFTPTVRYCGLTPAKGALLYGLAGMGAGALVGSLFRSALWEPLAPDQLAPLRVAVAPLPRGGLALGASLAF